MFAQELPGRTLARAQSAGHEVVGDVDHIRVEQAAVPGHRVEDADGGDQRRHGKDEHELPAAAQKEQAEQISAAGA